MQETPAQALVRSLERKKLRRRLGVSEQAISNAIGAGAFPSSWFVAMRELGAERGVDVPLDMFRWREAAE